MNHLLINAFVITAINFLHDWFSMGSSYGYVVDCLAPLALFLGTKNTILDLCYKITPTKCTILLFETACLLHQPCWVLNLRSRLLTPNIVVWSRITYLWRIMQYFLSLFHLGHMIYTLHFLAECHFLKLVLIYWHFISVGDSLSLKLSRAMFRGHQHARRSGEKGVMWHLIIHL